MTSRFGSFPWYTLGGKQRHPDLSPYSQVFTDCNIRESLIVRILKKTHFTANEFVMDF